MKSINVYRSNGIVKIDVSIDVENNRKSELHISDKRAEEKFNKVLTKVKAFSKFKRLSLSYNEMDYYDNMIDVYETPYINYTKGAGKRKPTISHCEHGCIPKEWEECFSLTLDNPKTIKPIEVFLNHFNITLTSKQLKEIRKAMKGESSYCTEI